MKQYFCRVIRSQLDIFPNEIEIVYWKAAVSISFRIC